MSSRKMAGGREGTGRGQTRRVVSNPDDSDDDHNNLNDGPGPARLEDQSFEATQRAIAMADLGSGTRARITADDIQYGPTMAEHKMNRLRKANQEGTEEHLARQKNERQTSAWNMYQHDAPQDHEDLEDIGQGQSHRARLMEDLQEERAGDTQGFNVHTSNHHRSRSVASLGSSGRGHRASRSIGRGGGFAGGRGRSSPIRNTNRPLDPAVDPEREYGYSGKGGWRPVAQTGDELHKDAFRGKSRSAGGRGGKASQHSTSQAKNGGAISTRREPHALPTWLELEENPVGKSGEQSLDERIVEMTSSVSRLHVSDKDENKSPLLASKYANPNVQTISSTFSKAVASAPIRTRTTSTETFADKLREHASNASETVRQREAAAKLASPQANSTGFQPSESSLAAIENVSKTEELSPLGAMSREFMSHVNQGTFDQNAYGRPPRRSNAAAAIDAGTQQLSEAREPTQQIRKIPVAELASSRQDDEAERTDGRPTPQSLPSGFTSVTGTPASGSIPTFSAEAPTQAAVGLGINLGADPSTTSPTGMTSPIMDEPLINLDTSPIKANQQAVPDYIEINGQKYVLASTIPAHALPGHESQSTTNVNSLAHRTVNAASQVPARKETRLLTGNPFSSPSDSQTSTHHGRSPSLQHSFDVVLQKVLASAKSPKIGGGSGSPVASNAFANPFTHHGTGLISTARTAPPMSSSVLTGMDHTLVRGVSFEPSPRKQPAAAASAEHQPDRAPELPETKSSESTPLIDSDTEMTDVGENEADVPTPRPNIDLPTAAEPIRQPFIGPAMQERSPNVRPNVRSSIWATQNTQSIIGDNRNVMGFMGRGGRGGKPRGSMHARNRPRHAAASVGPGYAQLLVDLAADGTSLPLATGTRLNATTSMPQPNVSDPIARNVAAGQGTEQTRREDHQSDAESDL